MSANEFDFEAALGDTDVGEPEETVETPVVETPVEPVKEEIPAPVDADAPAEPEEEEETSEVDPELLALLNKMTAPVAPRQDSTIEKTFEKVDQQQQTDKSEIKPEDLFDDKFDYDRTFENGDEFKKFMVGFAEKVQKNAEAKAYERFLKNVPEVIASYTSTQVSVYDQAREFYKTNPELSVIKPIVAQIANRVSAEHADWNTEKVFNETAVQAKKLLSAVSKKGKKPPKATVPKDQSRPTPGSGPELAGLAREIEEMLDL